MRLQNRAALLVALTVARLLLLVGLAWAIPRSFAEAMVWLAAIVLADVYDGVFARKFGVDGGVRRAVDSIIDVISIMVAFAVVTRHHPEYLHGVYLVDLIVLAAGQLLGTTPCALSLWRNKVLIHGFFRHRDTTLGFCLLGILMIYGVGPGVFNLVAGTFGAVLGISAGDYWFVYWRKVRPQFKGNLELRVIDTGCHPNHPARLRPRAAEDVSTKPGPTPG
ncbi:MAG TPA: CDP-alcohol phosphatidyltransferase family protein [Candidatus Polarisedimenticolaceae bacterium]|nr:CDP-alcohol phosphatidyltransferase family protein [Candidatus Polarisedimenticolaceae bacterium]